MKERTRFTNLDLLRLFLALEVLASHSWQILHSAKIPFFLEPVAAFVALSGFVIPGSLARSQNWQEFAWKRVLRVYPAFFASIALTACLIGMRSIGPSLLAYLTIGMVNIAFANLVLWSLMLEEILYAFHALTRKIFTLQFSIWCAAVLLVAALVFQLVFSLDGWASSGIDRILRTAPCFFVGNILYLKRDDLKRIPLSLCLVGLIVAVTIVCTTTWQSPLRLVSIPLGAASALILGVRLPQVPEFPDFSYSLYLYHYPISLWMASRGYYNTLLFVVASVSVCVASFYLVEKPALKLRNRPWQLPRRKSPEPQIVEAVA